ncbi:MAG: hypothetical protein AMS24_01170 [Chlamydiae bacterium SM23_39]|nr:MAG: hypothetical protein AMS24_01170 [Chlamydiae bacterium SM23_39]
MTATLLINNERYFLYKKNFIQEGFRYKISVITKIFFKTLKYIEKIGYQLLFYPYIFSSLSGKQVKIIVNSLDFVGILRKCSSIFRLIFLGFEILEFSNKFQNYSLEEKVEKSIYKFIILIKDLSTFLFHWLSILFKNQKIVINIFGKSAACFSFIKDGYDTVNGIRELIKYHKMSHWIIEKDEDIEKFVNLNDEFLLSIKQKMFQRYCLEKKIIVGIKISISVSNLSISIFLIIGYISGNKFFSKTLFWVFNGAGIILSFANRSYILFFSKYKLGKLEEKNKNNLIK